MKKVICLTLALIMVLSLTACVPKLQSGEVYDKKFTAAHTQIMMIPFVHSNGETSYTTYTPFIYYYDDDYAISIKADDGSDETATYHVSKEVYDSIQIGSEFEYNSGTCSDNAPYTREQQN